MSQATRQSENAAVKRALESSYVPAPILESRRRQDDLLKQLLADGDYAIADIGCGNGYHALELAPFARLYHGFEIAPDIAQAARELWLAHGLDHAEIFVGDATELELADDFYDVVVCLYFTPGNFRDPSDDLSLYTDAYLDANPAFIRIIERFYAALKPGGRMLLTVYQDNTEAEAAQHDFYTHTDMHVLTPLGTRYVATAEGFWSARWSQRSMLSNLEACGIGQDSVKFHELSPIAWLVEIGKPL